MPIVKKHLIHEQRQPVLTAQSFDRGPLLGPGEVPSGIVGVDDGNSARVRGVHAAAQRLEVNVPAMIVEKLIRNQLHIIQLRQEIEQRVARLPNQHLVPGIAQQPEEEAVGFAGTGGEKDLLRIYTGSTTASRNTSSESNGRAGS